MQSDEARHKLDITQTYIGYKCKMMAKPIQNHMKATQCTFEGNERIGRRMNI